MKKWKKQWGHFSSQKFAALVFCVFVLSVAGFFMTATAFGNLTLAVVGLYTAFVGGRAWSDGQSLRYGGGVGTGDHDEPSVVRKLPVEKASVEKASVEKKRDEEID